MSQIGSFEFVAPLRSTSCGEWFFASVPQEISEEIAEVGAGIRRGFGSLRVAVTVGGTSWRTSIFPDTRSGTYMLPLKKAVRAAERLEVGDDVHAEIGLVDL